MLRDLQIFETMVVKGVVALYRLLLLQSVKLCKVIVFIPRKYVVCLSVEGTFDL